MNDNFYVRLKQIVGINVFKDIKVDNDTNIRTSATFAYKIEIFSFAILKEVFNVIKEYNKKYYILGKGSNVLFANDYFDGVLIKLSPMQSKELKIVYAGESVNYLNSKYLRLGIETFNFLSGVPCSVGGAIYMNAGAFNKEIKDIIEYVYAFNLNNFKIEVFDCASCQFKYRDSFFKDKNYLILGAKIKLIYKDMDTLLKQHHHYLKIRHDKLPLEYPNLGSIFKNPTNQYVGKLVEDLGLKGLSIGGAKISKKHGNVIINYRGASYDDILKLIRIIKDEIYLNYKIELEEEINIFK